MTQAFSVLVFSDKPLLIQWLLVLSFLRQVIGINYLIQMRTYRLPCGDSENTWVG